MTVNEGNDVTCKCNCKDGNPPANCIWFKDGTKTGEGKKKVNTLSRPDIKKIDGGNYTCVGLSHSSARDEKSITVTVYCKYLIKLDKKLFNPKSVLSRLTF